MEKEKKYFYCYSTNLKNYFDINGLPFITKDIHKKTGKTFWIYPSGRVLDILLKEYQNK